MTEPAYDVAVIGLGAMGSAASFHLAARGARVIGLDRFHPPHAMGSSHGDTRIIREAYFEDPRYVPMVQRAYTLWRELEAKSGRRLMIETGGLMIGAEEGVLVRGAKASAEAHRLPHERLERRDLERRFPVFTLPEAAVGIWEPRAGILFPEECIRAHLELASGAGAELRPGNPALDWRAEGGGFEVTTSEGRIRAERLVLATNAWIERLLPGVSLGLTITRQVLFWFEPRARAQDFEPERFPIYICESEPGRFFYGFPAIAGEVKVAPHDDGVRSDPDRLDRVVRDPEVEAMRNRLAAWLPDAAGRFTRAAVCMYASTPDRHFVIDRHPEHPGVLILSACSGHGFKFSSAIGEIAARLTVGERPGLDLDLFRIRS